jgi:hypothetical protein
MKTSSWLAIAGAVAIVTVAACKGEGEGDERARVEGQGPVAPLDHPPFGAAQGSSAGPRRLTVAQLERSLGIALGKDTQGRDITWRLANGTNGFASVSQALGEPDYLSTTDRAYEPSLLYAKFVDDAARSGCDQALDADATRATKGDRVLLRHVEITDTIETNAAGFDANIRYLKLRIHGVKLAADADTKPLSGLFTTAMKASVDPDPQVKGRAGWRAVCVALITAPEFQFY